MLLTDDELYALFVQAGFARAFPITERAPLSEIAPSPAALTHPFKPESLRPAIEDLAAMMTAIALRESAGDPSRYNGNAATGDCSLGLCQINLRDKDVVLGLAQHCPQALRMSGISTPVPALLDPEINVQAAFSLYAGSRHNMDILWYIDRPGAARDRWLALLPRAQAAASRYSESLPNPAQQIT